LEHERTGGKNQLETWDDNPKIGMGGDAMLDVLKMVPDTLHLLF
jgi:hypothetical protein